MKKLCFVMLINLTASVVFSQEVKKDWYTHRRNIFTLGVGFGTPYLDDQFKNDMIVNPTIIWERAAGRATVRKLGGEDIGPLLDLLTGFTVGGSFTYNKSIYNYDYYGYRYQYDCTTFYISARSSYHIFKPKKLDPYAGLGFGYVWMAVSDKQTKSTVAAGVVNNGFGWSVFGGCRYMFGNWIGVYGEVGYSSLAVASCGLTFNLR